MEREKRNTLGCGETPFVRTANTRYFLIAVLMNLTQLRMTGPLFSIIESKSSRDKSFDLRSSEFNSFALVGISWECWECGYSLGISLVESLHKARKITKQSVKMWFDALRTLSETLAF